ncbi:flagellar basal body protein [Yersinia frederiksenii]|nr:flagellar basal body protein [Yersinia frederiksenii]
MLGCHPEKSDTGLAVNNCVGRFTCHDVIRTTECSGVSMSVQGIEGVLQQLQVTALQASNSAKTLPAEAGFASELKAAIGKISENQQHARTQAQNFELGVPGVGLNDVMVDMQKSSVSLQLGIQVRNKLVAAYQDVMNMGV